MTDRIDAFGTALVIRSIHATRPIVKIRVIRNGLLVSADCVTGTAPVTGILFLPRPTGG